MNRKVTVVGGAGNVGATVARAVAHKELADVVVVDIAETKAQGIALDDESVFYFVGIDGARFKRPVEPGDQLVLHAAMDRSRGGIYKFKCHADVDGEVAAEAEIMCTMRKVV